MKFSDILVSSELKNRLRKQIETGRVAHAQLFEGDSGYSSLALALAYVQYVNCENHVDNDSCSVCRNCRMIESLEHPDLYFIYPISTPKGKKGKRDDFNSTDFIVEWRDIFLNSSPKGVFTENEWYERAGIGGEKGNTQGSIGRSDADYILSKMSFSPIEKGFRFFIIWLPERMNNVSANALLKLFEEPSEGTVFIFVTEDSNKVLPTIKSRTQTISVPPSERQDIKQYLIDKLGVNQDVAELVSSNCAGNIVTANEMLSASEKSVDMLDSFAQLMRFAYKNDYLSLIDWAENFALKNREEQKQFFIQAVKILRSSFMKSQGLDKIVYSFSDELEFVNNFHKVVNANNIEMLVASVEGCYKDLLQNGNAKIVSTHFALSLLKILRIK